MEGAVVIMKPGQLMLMMLTVLAVVVMTPGQLMLMLLMFGWLFLQILGS